MAMTIDEIKAKRQLMRVLKANGHSPYAEILRLLDLHLTSDPNVVAFFRPSDDTITINRNLGLQYADVIIRHEILHRFLQHPDRIAKFFERNGIIEDSQMHQLANMAADWEISNKGYTEDDIVLIKSLVFLGQKASGLVTSKDIPDHPELWGEDVGVEKLLKYLLDQLDQQDKDLQQDIQDMISSAQQQQENGGDSDGQGGSQSGQQKTGTSALLNDQGDENIQKAEELQREAEDVSDIIDELLDGQDIDDVEDEDMADAAKKVKKLIKAAKERLKGKQQGKAKSFGGALSDSGQPEDEGEMSPEDQLDKELGDIQDTVDEIADQAQQAKELADAIRDEARDRGFILPDKSEEQKQEEVQRKIDELTRIFNDESKLAEIRRSDTVAKKMVQHKKEVARKQAELAKNNSQVVINQFKASIKHFLTNEMSPEEDDEVWGAYARRPHIQHPNALNPGDDEKNKRNIPLLNVYHDTSGSVTHTGVVPRILEAVESLRYFEKRKLIKLNIYPFSDEHTWQGVDVHNGGGGTTAFGIYEHIQHYGVENVVIITDSDTSYENLPQITVAGGVWLLFVNGKSQAMINTLHGKKLTEVYDMKVR